VTVEKVFHLAGVYEAEAGIQMLVKCLTDMFEDNMFWGYSPVVMVNSDHSTEETTEVVEALCEKFSGFICVSDTSSLLPAVHQLVDNYFAGLSAVNIQKLELTEDIPSFWWNVAEFAHDSLVRLHETLGRTFLEEPRQLKAPKPWAELSKTQKEILVRDAANVATTGAMLVTNPDGSAYTEPLFLQARRGLLNFAFNLYHLGQNPLDQPNEDHP